MMKLLYLLSFFFIFISTDCCHAQDLLEKHHQLLVVTTRGWENQQGNLQLYERLVEDKTKICFLLSTVFQIAYMVCGSTRKKSSRWQKNENN